MPRKVQYQFKEEFLHHSEPLVTKEEDLKSEEMLINIGPQHPATHGTLRIVVRLDGERVVAAEPIMGYMHRGYEKLAEVRTYPQVTTLVNRIDWLGSFANEVPFILAAERLMDVEAPPRAQWIRTVLFELSRIANVVLFLGDMGVQLGAVTPVLSIGMLNVWLPMVTFRLVAPGWLTEPSESLT